MNSPESRPSIPNQFFFVWYGDAFPMSHYLAIKSAWQSCRADRISLYCSEPLGHRPYFRRLLDEVPCLEVKTLAIDTLLERAALPNRQPLAQAYGWLHERRCFAALSDLLRYLLLYTEGGVYLDLDVLVIQSLAPLLDQQAFCGFEHLLVDRRAAERASRLRYFRTVPLTILRDVLSRVDRGPALFRRIEALFVKAINGAVLGATRGHPLLAEALARLPGLTREVLRQRPIIGPFLLQALLEEAHPDVLRCGPDRFYPLGPTMAHHFLRPTRDVAALAAAVITPETLVLHWYHDGSNRRAPPSDDAELRALADRQLFSHIAARFLP